MLNIEPVFQKQSESGDGIADSCSAPATSTLHRHTPPHALSSGTSHCVRFEPCSATPNPSGDPDGVSKSCRSARDEAGRFSKQHVGKFLSSYQIRSCRSACNHTKFCVTFSTWKRCRWYAKPCGIAEVTWQYKGTNREC
jgi:hypothetical protein